MDVRARILAAFKTSARQLQRHDVHDVFAHVWNAHDASVVRLNLTQGRGATASTVSLLLDAQALSVEYESAAPAHARALTRSLLPLVQALAAREGMFVENRSGWCAVTATAKPTTSFRSCTTMSAPRYVVRTLRHALTIVDAALDTFSARLGDIHTASNIELLHHKLLVLPHALAEDARAGQIGEDAMADARPRLDCTKYALPWFLDARYRPDDGVWENPPVAAAPLRGMAAKVLPYCVASIIGRGHCVSLALGQSISELVVRYSTTPKAVHISPMLRAIAAGVAIQPEYVSAVVTATVLTPERIQSPQTAVHDFLRVFSMVRLGLEKIESLQAYEFFTRDAQRTFLPELRDPATIQYMCSFSCIDIDGVPMFLPAAGVRIADAAADALGQTLFANRVRIMARLALFRDTHPYSTGYFYVVFAALFQQLMIALGVNVWYVGTAKPWFLHGRPTRWWLVLTGVPNHTDTAGVMNRRFHTVTSAAYYTDVPKLDAFVRAQHGPVDAAAVTSWLVLPLPVERELAPEERRRARDYLPKAR